MNSVIFSDDEARFLQQMLKMVEKPPDDHRASWIFNGFAMPQNKTKPAGEFRILVIGGQGVGKTSILTKFCTGIFPDPSALPSSSYLHGCRHPIALENARYTVDALELPVDHLASPEHLTQALAITDCAILVYDVTNPASLTFLKALSSEIRDALHAPANVQMTAPSPITRKKRTAFSFRHRSTSPARKDTEAGTLITTTKRRRNYHFLLLGAKSDVHPSFREVSWLEGQVAAGDFFGPAGVAAGTSVNFMEVSAKSGENVGAVFPLLGMEVLQSRRERKEVALLQQELRYGGLQGGAFGAGGALSSEFIVEDEGDTDESECADGRSAPTGSVRRRWCSLKRTLSVGVFNKKA